MHYENKAYTSAPVWGGVNDVPAVPRKATRDEMKNILFESAVEQRNLYLFFKQELEGYTDKEKKKMGQELARLDWIVTEQRNKYKMLINVIEKMYLKDEYDTYLKRHKKAAHRE